MAAGTRLVNDGLIALHEQDVDRASSLFRAAASRWHFKPVVGVALYDLGVVAVRRGDFADAVALSRAALGMLRGARFSVHPQTYGDLARGNLAFALACAGDVDEADRVLREPTDPNALPGTTAVLVRARALVALRRERWSHALAALDGERRLLRNTVVGSDAALLGAFEALALGKLADPARPTAPVQVDEEDRAYVLRVVPDAAPYLATL
jgi:hypothetical protein